MTTDKSKSRRILLCDDELHILRAAEFKFKRAGYDVEGAAASAGYDMSGRLRTMLARAQQAGAVRAGITYPDVKALMAGCLSRDVDDTDGTALSRLVTVVCDGLRARSS